MKKWLLALCLINTLAFAQTPAITTTDEFTDKRSVPVTPVKNQAMTGTCWCFSATSLVESQCIKHKGPELDLSEMFTVRNIYLEKAKNYILRQGHAQFGEGGLGHDLIRAMGTYGVMPQDAYTGLLTGQKMLNHGKLSADLKNYLDSILKFVPIAANWMDGYTKILDTGMGAVPTEFDYNGKKYTPQSFAKEVVKFNANDYINITSFTNQPYFEPFILQVPDNFSNGYYYNIPLNEMIQLTKDAVTNEYSVMWDADVSNNGFLQNKGLALLFNGDAKVDKSKLNADMEEAAWDTTIRQQLYENLTTQDDHLMHIFGVEKSKSGKLFFLVKNSWGNVGPYQGDINVSEAYFAINTISLVVPKAALSKALLQRMKIK